MNAARLDKGEIYDLKKKIVERDECIRELVLKINKIEKCVNSLQQNSNNAVINESQNGDRFVKISTNNLEIEKTKSKSTVMVQK